MQRMHRRAFIVTLTALPFTPDRLTNTGAPPLPVGETDEWWWGFVQYSISLDPTHCTEKYLDTAVKRSRLEHTSDEEAKRVLRAAFDDAYERSDVPSAYRK